MPKRDEIGRDGEKKKFYFRIPSILDSGEKILKKIAKKLKKLKKPLSDIIFCQNGMRLAGKREKIILPPNSVHARPGKKIQKKNGKKIEKTKKTSFRHYFLPKRDEIGRDGEKKNFNSEFRSYSTRVRKFRKK